MSGNRWQGRSDTRGQRWSGNDKRWSNNDSSWSDGGSTWGSSRREKSYESEYPRARKQSRKWEPSSSSRGYDEDSWLSKDGIKTAASLAGAAIGAFAYNKKKQREWWELPKMACDGVKWCRSWFTPAVPMLPVPPAMMLPTPMSPPPLMPPSMPLLGPAALPSPLSPQLLGAPPGLAPVLGGALTPDALQLQRLLLEAAARRDPPSGASGSGVSREMEVAADAARRDLLATLHAARDSALAADARTMLGGGTAGGAPASPPFSTPPPRTPVLPHLSPLRVPAPAPATPMCAFIPEKLEESMFHEPPEVREDREAREARALPGPIDLTVVNDLARFLGMTPKALAGKDAADSVPLGVLIAKLCDRHKSEDLARVLKTKLKIKARDLPEKKADLARTILDKYLAAHR